MAMAAPTPGTPARARIDACETRQVTRSLRVPGFKRGKQRAPRPRRATAATRGARLIRRIRKVKRCRRRELAFPMWLVLSIRSNHLSRPTIPADTECG